MTKTQLHIIKAYFSNQPVLKASSIVFLFLFSFCKNETTIKEKSKKEDKIVLSQKHENNLIWCDLDGDKKEEKVEIVINQKNNKSGLRITFGKGDRIDYFGLGKDVLQQEFDDFDWVGIFEKAPKGKTYWNNVNEDGEIKIEKEEFTKSDKLVLQNDGIYVHAAESCGGGIIYLENNAYKWLQQE